MNANFGVDADLHANQFQFGGFSNPSGKDDWFKSSLYSGSGLGVLDTTGAYSLYSFYASGGSLNKIFLRRANTTFFQTANNTIQVDAIMARDYFGGPGYVDTTAFGSGSKNAGNPNLWSTTSAPVQGKNDILDMYGHLRRAGTTNTSPLWLFMGASVSDPIGSRYMDFEFYQQPLTFNGTNFSTSASDEGHTAFVFNNSTGKITKTGDLIFSMSASGSTPSDFEIRIWISQAIYNSTFNPADFDFDRSGAYFDGASTNSIYGYAKIIPKGTTPLEACGIINSATTPAGPWGTLIPGGAYSSNYSANQFAEFGFNLSSFGIDPLSVNPSASVCSPAFAAYIIKTRASASFTAALKDFSGPYMFGGPPNISISIASSNILTCDTPSTTLTATASPPSSTAYYIWTLPDGTKQTGVSMSSITASLAGTYTLEIAPVEGCSVLGNATFNLTENKTAPASPTSPQGASYCVNGSTVPISVANPGAGFQIRWFIGASGGSVLATGTSYTPPTGGTYYAETRNTTTGCVSTRTAVTLTPISSPSVSLGSNTVTACLNSTTILTASLTGGTAPFTYQWQSSPNNTSWTNITGQTSATYQVPTTSVSNIYYRVLVTASNLSCSLVQSSSVNVDVVQGLTVTTPLVGFTECLTGTRSLTIGTSGGKNPTYQWQSSPNNSTWTNITGQTGTTYTPPSTTVGTNYYRVVISSDGNGCSSIQSNSVMAVIVANPTVNISTAASTVCVGGNAVLNVTLNDGSGTCSLQWQSSPDGSNWTNMSGQTNPTLTTSVLSSSMRYRVTLNCSASGCCN